MRFGPTEINIQNSVCECAHNHTPTNENFFLLELDNFKIKNLLTLYMDNKNQPSKFNPYTV